MSPQDGEIAKVVLQMPPTIQKEKGIEGDMVPILKESIFPEYAEELKNYDSLLEAADRQMMSLNNDLRSVFMSDAAGIAMKQEEDLKHITNSIG